MSRKDLKVPMIPGLLAAFVLAGCSYEDFDEPLPGPSPSDSAKVSAAQTRNYDVLKRMLGEPAGPVVLEDSGPMDGPARGFGTGADLHVPGQYMVSAACAGASDARMYVAQEDTQTGFRFYEIPVTCSRGVHTQFIELKQGYVAAHLLLPRPGDTPWTGAVGGLRITDMTAP